MSEAQSIESQQEAADNLEEQSVGAPALMEAPPGSLRAYLGKLSDRGIQRVVGGNAYLRGRIYARRGAVKDIHEHALRDETESSSGSELTALVAGHQDTAFDVRLFLDPEGALLSACNCNGWRGPKGHCKHVAAVMVAVRDAQRPPRPENKEVVRNSENQVNEPGVTNGKGEPHENGALSVYSVDALSSRTRNRRQKRRRRGEQAAAGHIEVLSGRELGLAGSNSAEGRTGLDSWLPPEDSVRSPELEFRLAIRSASIAVTPVLAGTRTALPIAELLTTLPTLKPELRPVLRSLLRHVLRGQSATAEMRGEDAAEVITMLQGRRVLLEPASMELRFSDEPLRPKIELELAGSDAVRLRVVFETRSNQMPAPGATRPTSRRFSFSSGAWFEGTPSWHIDLTDGTARKVVETVSPLWLQRLYKAPTLVHPMEDLPRLLTELVPRVATSLGADLPDLSAFADLVDAPVRFRLRIQGDLVEARARLDALYGDLVLPIPSSGFPSPLAIQNQRNSRRPQVLRRDIGSEVMAMQELLNCGFKAENEDTFGQHDPFEVVLRGDEAVHFWTEGIRTLPEHWERLVPSDLAEITVRSTTVTPQMRVSSGVDWLNLDMTFDAGGVAVDEDELKQCLEQGRKLVKLNDGTYAPVDPTQIREVLDRMAEIIVSSDAQGKHGKKLPLSQAGRVQDLMRLVASTAVADETRSLFGKLDAIGTIEPVSKPRSLKADLRPYQKEGFSWLVFLHNLGTGGILADDMGLGKTLQTIALFTWLKSKLKDVRILVVAPTSVVPNWAREIEKFAPSLKCALWHGADRHEQEKQAKSADIVVTSYALLRRDEEFLSSFDFEYVVLDEAQHIKNPLSATARAAKKLKSNRRLALTGTPIENRLSEIWSIFDFVSPGLLSTLQSFEEKYARPIDRGDAEAAARLRSTIHPFVMRRTKVEVAKDLPEKIEQDIIVPLAEEQQKLYSQILRQVRESVMSEMALQGAAKTQIQILAALTRLRQAACDPRLLKLSGEFDAEESGKLNALREIMTEAVAGGHKVLVFSQFVEMLKLIQDMFAKEGIRYEYLDGSTKDRQARVDHFNTDESVSAFLISLKAGGTGLNLIGADTVIHFDPWWNPAVEDQATDRAHRIGQTKVVNVYRLIAKGTVEEKILQLSGKKRELVAEVLSEEGSAKRGLSQDQVAELLAD